MSETRLGNFSVLSKNLRNNNNNNNSLQESTSTDSESAELKHFEAIASLVVHQNRVIAKEEQYCSSLLEHYNESEDKRQNLVKELEKCKQNIEAYDRRVQLLSSTQKKLGESLRSCRTRLNEVKEKVENKSTKRNDLITRISNISERHEQMFRKIQNKYPEELCEENESLYMKLDNLQRIRNQLKNKLAALQNAENNKTYDWNLWKEQCIRLAELLKPKETPSKKRTLSQFELLLEKKKLGCRAIPSCPSVLSDDRIPTIEKEREKNYSPQLKNISNHFNLTPSENSPFRQADQNPKSYNKLSNRPQISSTFKFTKLNLPTLKVPTFGLLFKNASSRVGNKIVTIPSSGSNEGEKRKAEDDFHKDQVDKIPERQEEDLGKQKKPIGTGNKVHSAVQEAPPQRPLQEKRIPKEKHEIAKDLRREATTRELQGKGLKHKNVFQNFLNSFSAPKDNPAKEIDNASKSANIAIVTHSQKEPATLQERIVKPTGERNKETRDLQGRNSDFITRNRFESSQMEISFENSKFNVDIPEEDSTHNNIIDETSCENMEVADRQLTELHADSMEVANSENSIKNPNENSENEQNKGENMTEHDEIARTTPEDVEMEVSASDAPEEGVVAMTSPSLHKQQQQPQETFSSHFSFSLFDQPEDFMSSFSEKGTGFSLYGSPNQEQGGNKNAKENPECPNFLFGAMQSPTPSFSFSFQGGAEDDQSEETTTPKSSHDFFSLFSSPSTDQNNHSSQPTFSIF